MSERTVPYIKTVTYCMMHFAVAVLVAYALSRSWTLAFSIGIIEPFIQTFTYHFHERGWAAIVKRRFSLAS